MNLGQIRNGELIVIDTNVLVYANQQKSQQCVQLLHRCVRDDVEAVVPIPMVAELMHTLMLLEARENGWIERANPSRALSDKPGLVKRLSNYEKQISQFLGIGLRLESVVTVDIIETLSIQREFGLLTNDALLVAVARRLNCGSIVSADRAFAALSGFMVYAPSDLEDAL